MLGDLTIVGFGHFVLASLLSLDVVLHKNRPVSAVLWLGLLWAMPFIGVVGYLSFGMDRVRRGAALREASNRIVREQALRHPTLERMAVRDGDGNVLEQHPAARIFKATDPAVARSPVLRGNRVELLVDGDQYYPCLLEAIANARSSIHLQTFIFGRDRTGHEFLDALIERVRAGVEVRLLYDRFGSTYAHFSGFFRRAIRAGVKVKSITQVYPLKGRFQVNLRNHRKVAVIDGTTGFVGGINLQDRNRTGDVDGPPLRDYHARIEGPAVAGLQFQFIEDWYFATRESLKHLLTADYFPPLEMVDEGLVQVVPSGPERGGSVIGDVFFGAIVGSETSLTIVTPYFVPDDPILQALRHAALRGVDVRIVVPRRSNHRYAEYAARSLYGSLLASGVRIFERFEPFLHAKALVVDDDYAFIGSANLDYRSLHVNFETNIEVHHHAFLSSLVAQVEDEIRHSEEITLVAHMQRPLVRRIAENFCFLFQPML